MNGPGRDEVIDLKIGYYVDIEGAGNSRENPSALIRRVSGEDKLDLYKFVDDKGWVEDFYNLASWFYDEQDLIQITEEETGAIIERWTGESAEKHLRDLPWEPGEEGVVIATTYMF